jgi:hypothetical protein
LAQGLNPKARSLRPHANALARPRFVTASYCNTGQAKDAFGISRALRMLESNLKQTMENQVRAATTQDEDEAEGDDGADSRPSTAA